MDMRLLARGEGSVLVRDGCTLVSSSVSDDEIVTWGARVGRVGKVRGVGGREVGVVVSGKVGEVGDMPGVLRRRYADMGVLTARSDDESYTLMDRLCLNRFDKGGKEAVVDWDRIDKSLSMIWESNRQTHAHRL